MRVFSILLLSVLLTACGFQLRGLNKQLSDQFSLVYLKEISNTNQTFEDKVKKLFLTSGGRMTDLQSAETAIYISPIEVSSRQISLSSSGSLKEYENRYKTTVTIINLKDKSQIGERTLISTQYIQLNDLSPIASEEQKEITLNAAENELSQNIISYLSSF